MSQQNPGHRKDQWLFLATEVHRKTNQVANLMKLSRLKKNQISEFTRIKPFFFSNKTTAPIFPQGVLVAGFHHVRFFLMFIPQMNNLGFGNLPWRFRTQTNRRLPKRCFSDGHNFFEMIHVDGRKSFALIWTKHCIQVVNVFFRKNMSPLIWLRIKILRFYGLTCFTWKYGK